MDLKIFKLTPTAKLPSKAHSGPFEDAAYDLYYDGQDMYISDAGPQAMSTGIKVLIPSGHWIKFHEKSGKALKGLDIHGGVIDSGYTGELKVIVTASKSFYLTRGDAICQMSLERVHSADIVEISELQFNEEQVLRERKENGFGSTGN